MSFFKFVTLFQVRKFKNVTKFEPIYGVFLTIFASKNQSMAFFVIKREIAKYFAINGSNYCSRKSAENKYDEL